MTIAQSAFVFGDYIMPIATTLKRVEYNTLIEDSHLLGLPGSYAPPGLAEGAKITLQVAMGGGGDVSPTTSLPMKTSDDVNNEANQLYSRLQKGYEELLFGMTPARYIMAQKRTWDLEPYEGSGRRHVDMNIEFFAPDPRWLSTLVHSLTLTGTGNNAINLGTARSYPVFTITAGTNPGVRVHSPNPPVGLDYYLELDLQYTVAAGEILIIDCDPRQRWQGIRLKSVGGTVYVPRIDLINNIINNFGTDDTFPFFDPGTSVVDVLGTGTAMTVTWNDAWGL